MDTRAGPVQTLDDARISFGENQSLLIRYRTGTKDLHTIQENFTKQPYSLSKCTWMPRHRAVEEEYERLTAAGLVPLIVDAGANLGASAIHFALRYPKARILAIEPEAETFDLLRHNTKTMAQIQCIHGAVAANGGMANVYDPGRSTDAYRAVVGTQSDGKLLGQVKAFSIRDLLQAAVGSHPLLLKIDIEGGEAELFSGDTSWVDDFPAIAIELHDWMLPGRATSASFLNSVVRHNRDFINHPGTDIVFSLRNGANAAQLPAGAASST